MQGSFIDFSFVLIGLIIGFIALNYIIRKKERELNNLKKFIKALELKSFISISSSKIRRKQYVS